MSEKKKTPKSDNGTKLPPDRVRITLGNAARTLVGVRRAWESDVFLKDGRMCVAQDAGDRMRRVLDVIADSVADLKIKILEHSTTRPTGK